MNDANTALDDVATPAPSESSLVKLLRTTVFPLILLVICPPSMLVLWMAAHHYDGSFIKLWEAGLAGTAGKWPWPSWEAGRTIGTFALFELVLLLALPGKTHLGPVTPMGNRPSYRLNGVPAFILTHLVLFGVAAPLGYFNPGAVYDQLGSILITLSVVALLFCAMLYIKGVYAPSSTDVGVSGNPIWDFYWGTELHPRIGNLNLKQLANCRVAMMGWSVLISCYAWKQHQLYGHVASSMWVSLILQQVYIFKFFVWESGYFGSLDIMHDRFGFYICWGVLALLPCVYTITGQYLVNHPRELSPLASLAILVMGLGAIWANYDADAQRQRVRETGGKTTVWGRPPETLLAHYRVGNGERKESLLLVCGWWAVARHFHYVAELALALAWSLPAGFSHPLPYIYFFFLTILLVDRSGRDDLRCRIKYGATWDVYCKRVPYKILPPLY